MPHYYQGHGSPWRELVIYFNPAARLTFEHTYWHVVDSLYAGLRNVVIAPDFPHLDAIGGAINDLLKKKVLNREDLSVRLDLAVTRDSLFNNRVGLNLLERFNFCMDKMKIDKIDILMVRVPTATDVPPNLSRLTTSRILSVGVKTSWSQMISIQKTGRATCIGVSNLNSENLHCIKRMRGSEPVLPNIAFFERPDMRIIQSCELMGIPCFFFFRLL